MCVNGWMRGINCKALWIKALYKCSPLLVPLSALESLPWTYLQRSPGCQTCKSFIGTTYACDLQVWLHCVKQSWLGEKNTKSKKMYIMLRTLQMWVNFSTLITIQVKWISEDHCFMDECKWSLPLTKCPWWKLGLVKVSWSYIEKTFLYCKIKPTDKLWKPNCHSRNKLTQIYLKGRQQWLLLLSLLLQQHGLTFLAISGVNGSESH